MPERLSPRDRHKAREAALQMLYQWEVGRIDAAEVPPAFWTLERGGVLPAPALRALAGELALGTIRRVTDLDRLIEAHTEHWRLPRMSVVDRQILRLAVFELQESPAVPAAVVINEALELARRFSTEDAVRFVNGVLDAIRRDLAGGGAQPDPGP